MEDLEYKAIQDSIKLLEKHLQEPDRNPETITQILPKILNQEASEGLQLIQDLIADLPPEIQRKVNQSLKTGGYNYQVVNGQLKHKG